MSRYINYDALDYRNDKMMGKSNDFIDGVIYMVQRIEEAPSIEIIKCYKCKHWSQAPKTERGWCDKCDGLLEPTFFCADGEVRDE